jgi:hypothetical protein
MLIQAKKPSGRVYNSELTKKQQATNENIGGGYITNFGAQENTILTNSAAAATQGLNSHLSTTVQNGIDFINIQTNVDHKLNQRNSGLKYKTDLRKAGSITPYVNAMRQNLNENLQELTETLYGVRDTLAAERQNLETVLNTKAQTFKNMADANLKTLNDQVVKMEDEMLELDRLSALIHANQARTLEFQKDEVAQIIH